MTENELIELCKREDRSAQKAFFDSYAPLMFGVSKRYVKTKEDAEDIMIEGLYKALANIHSYQGAGSFQGWVRRIVVNEALMFLRKKHNFQVDEEISPNLTITSDFNIDHDLAAQEILGLLDKLPTGYRTVFNLYVVEGYKHKEIAEILGISINTSKSQLILAKERMQKLIIERSYLIIGVLVYLLTNG